MNGINLFETIVLRRMYIPAALHVRYFAFVPRRISHFQFTFVELVNKIKTSCINNAFQISDANSDVRETLNHFRRGRKIVQHRLSIKQDI